MIRKSASRSPRVSSARRTISTAQEPRPDAGARRQQILDAATRLFLEKGYGAATTNLLIERVGGSKSTVYGHFENKEKLFAAVVDNVLAQLQAATDTFDLPGESLRDGLFAVGIRLLSIVLSDDHVALARIVIAEARRFPKVGKIYYEHGPALALQGVVEFLVDRNAIAGGDIDDIRDAAEWFTSRLVHRAFFRALCGSDSPAKPGEIAREARSIANGFIARFAASAGTLSA